MPRTLTSGCSSACSGMWSMAELRAIPDGEAVLGYRVDSNKWVYDDVREFRHLDRESHIIAIGDIFEVATMADMPECAVVREMHAAIGRYGVAKRLLREGVLELAIVNADSKLSCFDYHPSWLRRASLPGAREGEPDCSLCKEGRKSATEGDRLADFFRMSAAEWAAKYPEP